MIKDEILTEFYNYESDIVNHESDYLQTHGKYFQGVPVHTSTPVQDNPQQVKRTAPDNLGQSLHDQPHVWPPGLLPLLLISQVMIDVINVNEAYNIKLQYIDENGDLWEWGKMYPSEVITDWRVLDVTS